MSEEYKCIKCDHFDSEHNSDNRGECLVDGCNCTGLE